jgi:hypothetical protein
MQQRYLFWDELRSDQISAAITQFGPVDAWMALKRARPSSLLTAWDDQTLVAISVMTHDRLAIQGTVVDVATIRRQSYIAIYDKTADVELTMMHAAAAHDEGIGIVLRTGDAAFWAAYGFAPISFEVTTTWPQTPQMSRPQPGTIQRIAANSDILQRVSDIQRVRPTGTVDIVDWEDIGPSDWLLLNNRDGQLRGAAQLESTELGTVCRRAVVTDDGAAGDLIDGLVDTFGASRLSFTLSPEHPIVRMALAVGAETRMHAAPSFGVLAGIIDLPTMLTALVPAFSARIAASGYAVWVGGVRLEISDERAMIMLNAGVVTIIDGTREAAVRIRGIELPALAQLCFGYRSVSALRRAGMLVCDDTELPLCEILFPCITPVLPFFRS